MNKKEVIEKLSKVTNLSIEQCTMINDVLEDNFIIGKKNKEKIISDIVEKVHLDEAKAEEVYESFAGIMKDGILDKIKHPFRSQD
ncbi:MAG: hypothetical protein IJ193_02430 [Bacilli bacterium]|nr:hypothetical protein [Bacilli bacterium]